MATNQDPACVVENKNNLPNECFPFSIKETSLH